MQKGKSLEFLCQSCKSPIQFSVFQLEEQPVLTCPKCSKKYAFADATLQGQMKKFENLCSTIIDSEEIMGLASVGVDVGDRHVKIPYKILLTRLNSTLDLVMNGEPVSIQFRIEPTKDLV